MPIVSFYLIEQNKFAILIISIRLETIWLKFYPWNRHIFVDLGCMLNFSLQAYVEVGFLTDES